MNTKPRRASSSSKIAALRQVQRKRLVPSLSVLRWSAADESSQEDWRKVFLPTKDHDLAPVLELHGDQLFLHVAAKDGANNRSHWSERNGTCDAPRGLASERPTFVVIKDRGRCN